MNKLKLIGPMIWICICVIAILIINPMCLADEVSKQRYVVLVYDDSGSMSANNSTDWEKANYSLQSLAALLDAKDKLYVVRMSKPDKPEEIQLGQERQRAMDQIRKASPGNSPRTPFETVRTAASWVEKAPRSYQRWLVVLSDGRFHSGNEYISTSEFSSYLDEYRNRGSNSDINMIFLAIGKQVPEDLKMAWEMAVGQPVLDARDSKDIIDQMNSISALITSRDPLHPQEGNLTIKYIGENQVRLTSPFPLRRLTILHQGRQDAPLTLKNILINGKVGQLPLLGPFQTGTPMTGKESISGRVMHLGTGQTIIPAGDYMLTFAENARAQKSSIKYLAETAMDFRCGLYKKSGGKWIPVSSENALEGDKVEARVEILDAAAGDQPLKLAGIKDMINVTANIGSQRGIKFQPDLDRNCFTARGIELKPGTNNARFTLTVRGWYQGSRNIRLQVKSLVARDLGLTVNPKEWSAKLDQMDTAKPIILTPTINGNPMNEDEFAEIKDRLIILSSDVGVRVENGKQYFELYPEKSWFGLLFTPIGQFDLKAQLQGRVVGEAASTDFQVTIEDIPWQQKYGSLISWPPVVILLGVYIYGVYRKPRFFHKAGVLKYHREIPGDKDNSLEPKIHRLYSNSVNRYLIPFIPEKVRIDGVKFVATGDPWSLKINPDGLKNVLNDQQAGMKLAGIQVHPEDLGSDLVMGMGQELVIKSAVGIQVFRFEPLG